MEIFQNIATYLPDIFTPYNFGAMLLGIVVGLAIGAMPGLNAPMAIALLLPFTFFMPADSALIMLASLYAASIYGGSFSAILLGVPGTAASAATSIEGWELTKQGRHVEALRISMLASVVGGVLSGIALLFGGPYLGRAALAFQPTEMFLLAIFGLLTVGGIASGSPVKGLISAFLGIMMATIGIDPKSAFARYWFGIDVLQGGIRLVPAIIGLFAFAQTLEIAKGRGEAITATKPAMTWKIYPRWADFIRYKFVLARSWTIGLIIGFIPGAGASIAQWIAYGEEVRRRKPGDRFGKGELKGVAAAEGANNSTTGTTLIPMFALGIPGGISAAIILGALMLHGFMPGFELFSKHPDIVYPIILAFILANVLMGFIALGVGRGLMQVVTVPRTILVPTLLVVCVAGTFGAEQNWDQVWVMCALGIFGYFMRQHGFSTPAMLLGIILAPICETGYRNWLQVAGANPMAYMLGRPLSIVLLALVIVTLVFTIVREVRRPKESGIGLEEV